LSSYYIIRPIRDQMGVAGGVNNLQWLFTASLVGMLLLNLPFAWLVAKLPRSRFIPITYRFFIANILIFAAVLHWSDPEASVWIGRVFFVWVSIFNLFVISVFWQMNVDLFSSEQGKRLFGIIAAGATVGAIVGASVTASLARYVAPTFLLLGSASDACRGFRRRCGKYIGPPRRPRARSRSAAACSAASSTRSALSTLSTSPLFCCCIL
jgi:AAA family ATP:ADP antiporter